MSGVRETAGCGGRPSVGWFRARLHALLENCLVCSVVGPLEDKILLTKRVYGEELNFLWAFGSWVRPDIEMRDTQASMTAFRASIVEL